MTPERFREIYRPVIPWPIVELLLVKAVILNEPWSKVEAEAKMVAEHLTKVNEQEKAGDTIEYLIRTADKTWHICKLDVLPHEPGEDRDVANTGLDLVWRDRNGVVVCKANQEIDIQLLPR